MVPHVELAQMLEIAESRGAFRWNIQMQLTSGRTHDGKFLGISIAPTNGRWVVVAIETDSSNTGSLNRFFDRHAHQIVGQRYRTAAAAHRAAEKFYRRWRRLTVAADPCECVDIVGDES